MRINSFDDSDVSGKVMKTATFTASGTWTKPDGVEFVLIDMCAGGGGGNGMAVNLSYTLGGGAGQYYRDKLVETPDESYLVTISSAGTGGYNGTGTSGGVCSFGSLLSASGGAGGGGHIGFPVSSASGAYQSKGGDGVDCPGWGCGGSGGVPVNYTTGKGGTGFGAGGGSGAQSATVATMGGNGAPGIVIIKWFE